MSEKGHFETRLKESRLKGKQETPLKGNRTEGKHD